MDARSHMQYPRAHRLVVACELAILLIFAVLIPLAAGLPPAFMPVAVVILIAMWVAARVACACPSTFGRVRSDILREYWYRRARWGWRLPRRVLSMLGSAVVVVVAGMAVEWVASSLGYSAPTGPTARARAADVTGANGVPMQVGKIVLLSLLGPLLEEVVWRGYALPLVRDLVGGRFGTVIAVLATSILFGLSHDRDFVGQMVTAFHGVLYAVVALRFRSILAGWTAHAGWNSMETVCVLTSPE